MSPQPSDKFHTGAALILRAIHAYTHCGCDNIGMWGPITILLICLCST